MSHCVAITVVAPGDLDVAMDPRFGRAPALLIVDPDTQEVTQAVENAAAREAHGAGLSAASAVADLGVSAVISGRFGPKAYEALRARRIAMWTAPEGLTAREALERYRNGELTQFSVRVL